MLRALFASDFGETAFFRASKRQKEFKKLLFQESLQAKGASKDVLELPSLSELTFNSDMRKRSTKIATIAFDNGRNSSMASYQHNKRYIDDVYTVGECVLL